MDCERFDRLGDPVSAPRPVPVVRLDELEVEIARGDAVAVFLEGLMDRLT